MLTDAVPKWEAPFPRLRRRRGYETPYKLYGDALGGLRMRPNPLVEPILVE